ncbi:MAG: hypothetical protein KDB18_13805, partial [Salinibacterium sp.]|nr:hypothetical protein [Salinibacterium sp.]
FPYSTRRGTPAATMPDHVPSNEIHRRKQVMADLDDLMARRFKESFLGETVPILFEERRAPGGDRLTGLSDRFLRVEASGPDALMNQIVPVTLDAVEGSVLRGRLVGSMTAP